MTVLPHDIEWPARNLGWRFYPSWPNNRAACFRGAIEAATADIDQLARWQRQYERPNWRLVMERSGIRGIDIDAPDTHGVDGIAAFRDLCAGRELPPGPRTRSGGGGLALIYRNEGHPIIGRTGYPASGIDPRRGRQTITMPPSVHIVTGRPYRWITTPWDVAPPPAPAWLLAAFAPPPEPARPVGPTITTSDRATRRLRRAVDAVLDAAKGASNDTLNRHAFAVARHVAAGTLGEGEAVQALYAAARHRGVPHHEARDTIRSAFRGGYAKPLDARGAA